MLLPPNLHPTRDAPPPPHPPIPTALSSSSSHLAYEEMDQAAAAVVKCPRCDSPNTKFCYYNNYSLNQPRHFCKTCRRYWTKGGALRNVPVGGGCRKNKRCRPSSSSDKPCGAGAGGLCSASIDQLQRLSMYPALPQTKLPSPGRSAYAEARGFPLHSGFGAADGCLVGGLAAPSLSFADLYTPSGFGSHNYPIQALLGGDAASGSPSSSSAANPSLASSIESLSSVNQLLHWKLQQQRLGVFQMDTSAVSTPGALPASANYRPFQIQQPPPPSHAAGRGVQSSDPARLLDGEGGWCTGTSCAVGGLDLAADTNNWSTGILNWSTDVLHQFNH